MYKNITTDNGFNCIFSFRRGLGCLLRFLGTMTVDVVVLHTSLSPMALSPFIFLPPHALTSFVCPLPIPTFLSPSPDFIPLLFFHSTLPHSPLYFPLSSNFVFPPSHFPSPCMSPRPITFSSPIRPHPTPSSLSLSPPYSNPTLVTGWVR